MLFLKTYTFNRTPSSILTATFKISKIYRVHKHLLFVISPLLFTTFVSLSYADDDDPCGGENSLLAVLDRPTVGDSVCVVKSGQVVSEIGYQYQFLIGGGQGYNYPQPTLRFGLPHNNELVFLPPNYIHQNTYGFGPVVLGIKHEFGYTAQWVASGETLVALPSGSSEFGSANVGSAVNGIASYNFTPTIAMTGMFGFTTQSAASAEGGQRFNSFNPDIVLTWTARPRLQFYAEFYGQTQTGPGEGFGCNVDGGIQYLPKPFLELDVEEGIRINGNLGGFNNYSGFGIGLLFNA